MILYIVMIFAVGVLTRIADMIADDGLHVNRYIGYLVGALYGFMAAYAMVAEPLLSELVIAVIIAVILTGKVDHPVHYIAIGAMLLVIVYFGMPGISMVFLGLFLSAGIFDEVMNGLYDMRRLPRAIGEFFRYRLTMEAVTFLVSLYTGYWIIFLSMLAYDAGFSYVFTGGVRKKLIRFSGQR